MSMHLLWNQLPQQAKKVMMNMDTPTAMRRESALTAEYCGRRVL
jgi:hypothetical protein